MARVESARMNATMSIHRPIVRIHPSHILQPFGKRAFFSEQEPVGRAQRLNLGAREIPAAKPHHVEADETGAVAGGGAVRDDVLHYRGHPADDGMRADPAMLVDSGQPADDREIADEDVTAQGRVVGEDDMIPDQAVMGPHGPPP